MTQPISSSDRPFKGMHINTGIAKFTARSTDWNRDTSITLLRYIIDWAVMGSRLSAFDDRYWNLVQAVAWVICRSKNLGEGHCQSN